MSAPSAEVVDRLERLATHAPGRTDDPDTLWVRGRRRQRRRTASLLAGIVAAGVVATAVTPAVLARVDQPVAASSERMVLPDLLRAPGAWEPAFTEAPSRLSAVGVGQRSSLFSSSATLWGVAAATGEARWLALPDAVPSAGADAQLSADGRRLAYWVTGEVAGRPMSMGGTEDDTPIVGLGVMDLETGEVTRWVVDSDHGLSVNGLVWAGDVLWWQGGPIVPMGNSASGASLSTRIWDLGTDERVEVGDKDPRAGTYLAEPGQAPGGFVTLPRSFRLERVIGAAAAESVRMDLPPDAPSSAALRDPEVGPDGRTVAALMIPNGTQYDFTADQQLVVGTEEDGTVVLREAGSAQSVLGWHSPTEVVTSSVTKTDENDVVTRTQVSLVDVTTGERTGLLESEGALPVSIAADAWTGDVVETPAAPFAPDPRVVGLGLLVGALVVWRGVVALRSRRGHP